MGRPALDGTSALLGNFSPFEYIVTVGGRDCGEGVTVGSREDSQGPWHAVDAHLVSVFLTQHAVVGCGKLLLKEFQITLRGLQEAFLWAMGTL